MNKYLKCSVWRLAVQYDIYVYVYIYIYIYIYTYVVRRQRVNLGLMVSVPKKNVTLCQLDSIHSTPASRQVQVCLVLQYCQDRKLYNAE
jgi:hypothetical protein